MVEAATEKPVLVVAALLLGGAALGYLLLPLIMVVVGRVIHREHLPRLRVAAVAAAAIGVISAIVLAGGISPATVAVALGYPIYFELRARFQVNTPGALALELATLVPVAIVLASLQPWPTHDRPSERRRPPAVSPHQRTPAFRAFRTPHIENATARRFPVAPPG
ncbi:hypothetical protein G3N30_14375 [Microbacterium lacticum]|uniref:hypothetical protein n=1 Tax=Microbacterium lacticum TaxID=33885 RepID=UPI0018B0725C|nr:hypothetical protein [Microbacterium lacticum]MBF9337351.1 hypothetical protein [Microbacterium lacticum]